MQGHATTSGSRSRRAVLATVAGAVLALGVSACGSDDKSTTTSGGDSTNAASSGAPSGNLRVVLAAPPSGLDPIVSARDGQYVWGTILEPLINVDSDEQPIKTGLVTDWSRPSKTTWKLTVRDGVTFTNGEPLNAAAVAFAIQENVDNPAGILKSYFANVRKVTAKGADTVVVTTKKPQVNFAELLTTVFALPPKYYEQQGTKGFTKAPIGSGPFVWKKEIPGRSMEVASNPDYWGDKPKLAGVTFTWATDAQQRLSLVQSDAADVVFDLPPTQADAAKGAGLPVESVPTAVKITAFLQADKAPFTDVNVRRAVGKAIDRDAIVKSVFQGQATADGGLLNVVPGTEPKEQVTPNLDEAKKLLNGKAPAVRLTYPTKYTNIQDVAEATAGMLGEAGFKVQLKPMDYGSFVTQVVKRNIDGLYLMGAVPNVAHADFFARGFLTSTSITANCPDPRLDALTEKALVQPDAAAAQKIYDQLNTLAVVDLACYAPIYRQTFNIATGKDVKGIVYTPLNVARFNEASIG